MYEMDKIDTTIFCLYRDAARENGEDPAPEDEKWKSVRLSVRPVVRPFDPFGLRVYYE